MEKIIVRGNDFTRSYSVGTFLRHGNFGTPIVEIDGKEYMSMGIAIPWSQEMCDLLDRKTNQEQWEFLKNLKLGISRYEQKEH